MYLELSESPIKVRKGLLQEKKNRFTNVSAYHRKGNNVPAHKRRLGEDENPNPYIFIPDATGGGKYVREDLFDDLDPLEWRKLMYELAPYQTEVNSGGMSESGFLGSRATRKAKREAKKLAKAEKKATKQTTKTERKKVRGENLKNIIGGITDTAKSIFGKGDQAGAGTEAEIPDTPDPTPDPPTNFFKDNQTALMIGGGVLLAGGIYYFATRK
jgi:hypothetical protein